MTATDARQGFFGLLKKSLKSDAPIQISYKMGQVVIISKENYESLLETLELLSIDGMAKSIQKARQDIHAGRTRSLKEIFG